MVVGKTERGIKRAIERCSLALALALALRIGKRHIGSNKDCVCEVEVASGMCFEEKLVTSCM